MPNNGEATFAATDLIAANDFKQYPKPVLRALLKSGEQLTLQEAHARVRKYLGLDPLPGAAPIDTVSEADAMRAAITAAQGGKSYGWRHIHSTR